MARGLGFGFISTPGLAVPQVGRSSELVSPQPLAVVPAGCAREGGQKSRRTNHGGGFGVVVLGSSASAVPRCRPARRLSCCRSLAVLRITFLSTAGLQTVVLGTKFISLGSAPFAGFGH